MNPEPPSIQKRSTVLRFFSWLFSWRGVRRMLIILAWIVTIIALLYAEENWRGRRAWNKQRQQLEARGEQLDLKEFIPKPVPDEQNFAAKPFVKAWFDRGLSQRQRWNDDYSLVKNHPQSSDGTRGRKLVNLFNWARSLEEARRGEVATNSQLAAIQPGELERAARAKAAAAVLEGLKSSEPGFAELRAASQRPFARYPVVYDMDNPWGILLPHLANAKSACQRLQLKACAELATGRSSNAFEDVKLILYLADSIKEEPFLISYLVRIACVQIAVQAIWEGLAEHRWSDGELQVLIARLQQYNFVSDVKRPLDSERAAGILTAELLYRNRKLRLSDLLGEPNEGLSATAAQTFARLAPHGWYHLEQLNYCRIFTMQMAGTFDPVTRKVFPQQIATNDCELQRQVGGGSLGKTLYGVLHHQLVAALLLPAVGNVPRKAATAQTATDQCAIACALERYRLANEKFPEKLEAVAPRFISQLPNDVITGAPCQYRRDGESFVLYSVGWNESDDGGVPGRTLFDEKSGDWVWEYPRN